MQTTESIDSRWLWGAILALVVVCYFLAPVLTPFVAGALLAYLGDPIVDQMERWRLNRTTRLLLPSPLLFLSTGPSPTGF